MKTLKNAGRLVAELRNTIGKSQSQFAAMIGVSKHTIISVENGRNDLSDKLAKRIRLATGAQLTSQHIRFEPDLFVPGFERSKDISPAVREFLHKRWDGTGKYDNLYTLEDFQQWRANFYPSNDNTARKLNKQIAKWIDIVLRAAGKPGRAGNRDRLPAVFQSLIDCLDETRTTFKLESEIDQLLENETHSTGIMAFHIAALCENPEAQEKLSEYGFEFLKLKRHFKNFRPNDWLFIETETRDVWDLPDGFSIPCERRKLLPKPKFWILPVDDIQHLNKLIKEKAEGQLEQKY